MAFRNVGCSVGLTCILVYNIQSEQILCMPRRRTLITSAGDVMIVARVAAIIPVTFVNLPRKYSLI